jgi:hypothetical protein
LHQWNIFLTQGHTDFLIFFWKWYDFSHYLWVYGPLKVNFYA